MSPAENAAGVWVPVCCDRVMRYNTLGVGDDIKGALVCTNCGKHIALEAEPLSSVSNYGKGSRVLSVLGLPKPPRGERRKGATEVSADGDSVEKKKNLHLGSGGGMECCADAGCGGHSGAC